MNFPIDETINDKLLPDHEMLRLVSSDTVEPEDEMDLLEEVSHNLATGFLTRDDSSPSATACSVERASQRYVQL